MGNDSEWLFWQLVTQALQHGGRGGQDARINHRLYFVPEVVEAVNAVIDAGFDRTVQNTGDLENFFRNSILEVHDQITRCKLRSPIEQSRTVRIGHRLEAGKQWRGFAVDSEQVNLQAKPEKSLTT